MHRRIEQFTQIVRRDIGAHTHRNTGGTVHQDMRHTRRQDFRFRQGTVKIGHPVNRTLPQLGQQQIGIAGQARLGVTHGGEGFGIIRRTPVALAVHQRIAIGKWLRHQHHGFITGTVTMGMEFTQYITDGTSRFLEFGTCLEAQIRHGINNTPLHRFEAVTDMRQGAIENNVHRIIEIRLLTKFL